MKSRKGMQNSMKSRKTIEKSLKNAMEKGTWPIVPYGSVTGLIVPYGACHGVTGSVRGVGRGGKSRPAWLKTGGSGCHLPGHRFEASRGCQMAGWLAGLAGWLVGSS